MSLTPGSWIGPFEVKDSIGAGGMGEVYRATDKKLKREVALKVLPSSVATSPDRLARFQREAEVLAALSHPNIATIYGLEGDGAAMALVMEYVEGPTLAERIAAGPLPVDEAVGIARQIAEALEAAHEQGIVHRDLKPANVKIRPDGTVKVLDFGLARAMEPSGTPAAAGSMAATITSPAMTQHGMILGTAAYMSPEQSRGKPVDRRADVWAFGVVLYEMLTGRRAFGDEDVSLTLSKVLQRDPDYTLLPAGVPPRVTRVIELCLRKDARQRASDLRDVRLALEGAFDVPAPPISGAVDRGRRDRMPWAVAGVATAAAVVLAVLLFLASRQEPPQPHRLSIPIPDGWELALSTGQGVPTALVISPDARRVAMVARQAGGPNTILIRDLEAPAARPMAGTEGASSLFWKPDSQSIAFFANGELKSVPVADGVPRSLAKVGPVFGGGTWNRDGTIVFSSTLTGTFRLHRIPDAGGEPADALPDPPDGQTANEIEIRPVFLPDGRHVLFTSTEDNGRRPAIWLGAIDSPERTRIVDTGSTNMQYASGHLLYVREGSLVAHPFDPEQRRVTGDPLPLARVMTHGVAPAGYGLFSASETGVLVHLEGAVSSGKTRLAWVDRRGATLETIGAPEDYWGIALSHDERHVAAIVGPDPTNIFVVNLSNGVRTQMTFGEANEFLPVWSSDDKFLDYYENGGPAFRKPSNNAGKSERTLPDQKGGTPVWDRTKTGALLYSVEGASALDLWVLPGTGARVPYPLDAGAGSANEAQASFDERWVAYRQSQPGEANALFVVPLAPPQETSGGRWSVGAGRVPSWRVDGRELYYLALPEQVLMAVQVNTAGDAFELGPAEELFSLRFPSGTGGWPYAVSKNGQRFLVLLDADADASRNANRQPAHIWLNWTNRLRQ